MGYRSIYGTRLGLDGSQLLVDGVPVGGSMPTAFGVGRTLYVDSNSNGGDGFSVKEALTTLQAAIDKLDALETASINVKGSTIVVMPDHAETITGIGGLTFDVAGIRVVGLGVGGQRPRFLMDGATSVTAAVSAADVTIENCVFAGGHNGIVTCFNVTAAGFTLRNCEFEDNTTDEHFLVAVTASAAADDMTIEGCRWVSVDSGITNFLSLSAIGVDRLKFVNNFMCVDAATAAGMIDCTATAGASGTVTGLWCCGNTLISGNTANIELVDVHGVGNTGVIGWNFIGHHDAAGSVPYDADGVRLWENYAHSGDDDQGEPNPVYATAGL